MCQSSKYYPNLIKPWKVFVFLPNKFNVSVKYATTNCPGSIPKFSVQAHCAWSIWHNLGNAATPQGHIYLTKNVNNLPKSKFSVNVYTYQMSILKKRNWFTGQAGSISAYCVYYIFKLIKILYYVLNTLIKQSLSYLFANKTRKLPDKTQTC